MAGVLYFITSYRRPQQLLRLVETIARESPQSHVLIHHDQFRTRLDAGEVEEVAPGAHLLSSAKPLKWGDFSVVDMHWRCFDWAISHLDFDWLVLLSEQDYPVWPLSQTEDLLGQSGADAFVESAAVQPNAWGQDRLRYHRYFYSYTALPGAELAHKVPAPWAPLWRRLRQRAVNRVNRRPGRLVRAVTYPDGMPTRVGVRRRTTPFTPSFSCWAGNAWFAISRAGVSEILSFTESHPSYRRHFRWTIVPEESATVTILRNSTALRVEAENLHFERWSDPYSGHPDVLRQDHLDEIIGSGKPFARKFDLAADAGVLDALDAHRLTPQST